MSRRPGAHRRPSKPNPHVLEEASRWLVEFTEGEIDVEAREEFIQWLRTSPEHGCAFLQISALWEDLPKLKEILQIDVNELVARSGVASNVVALRAAAPELRSSKELSKRTFPRARTAIAAAVVFGCLVVGATISVWIATRNTFSTGVGEQRSITLADGSTLELNADSRVRVRMNRDEREVILVKGQALFDVAKDPSRPFIVNSGGIRVRAVGTQFDVLNRQSATIVTVLEGRVAVSDSGISTQSPIATNLGTGESGTGELVSAGEQLTLSVQNTSRDGSTARSRPQRADVTAATAWRRHKLVFASSPLNEVVEAYNRYHEKRLILSDDAPSDFHVSGVFSTSDSVSLIDFLSAQPRIEVRETSRGFDILARK